MATTISERDVQAARAKLSDLEKRRSQFARQHVEAVSARRALLLDAPDDIKGLSKADQTVAQCERQLVMLDDAITTARERVSQLTATLAAQRDQEQREQKAKATEAFIPQLTSGVTGIAPLVEKLIQTLQDCAVPEALGASHLLRDAWDAVKREIEQRIVGELQAQARVLRAGPPPKPQAPQPPQPLLRPMLERLQGFVDHRIPSRDWPPTP